MKILLILAGTISLITGIIGIFLPVLPSTPFFILTTGLYLRSSPELYSRIISSPITGRYLSNSKGHYTARLILAAIAIMWTMIIITAVFLTDSAILRIILIAAGIAGTFFKCRIIVRETRRKSYPETLENNESGKGTLARDN